jgi:phosphoribosylformylglycinamidine synthase
MKCLRGADEKFSTERSAEHCSARTRQLFLPGNARRSVTQKTFLARLRRKISAKFSVARMKAKIIITPKKAVLDPQGKTVQTALEHMGYTGVTGVHIGKYIEIDLAPGTDKAAAEKVLNDAAHKLLSNPVIEDYRLEIE